MKIINGSEKAVEYLLTEKFIPPMSVGCSGGMDNSTRLFANYWGLWQEIMSGTGDRKLLQLRVYWHMLTHTFQKVTPMSMAHSFICLDSETVLEAAGSRLNLLFFKIPWGQVKTGGLKYFFGHDRWFEIYANRCMTADGAKLGSTFARGSIGVLYDTNLVKGFIDVDQTKDYDEPLAQNCTQNTTKIARECLVPFMVGIKDSKVHPMHIKQMAEADTDGWYKVCGWNGPEQKFTVY
jgi:hypothetical protein